jgi:23S rRNA (cytidine1920-2'-O)/16S rRNA (cytidine1409-2'-O)-methyltransferase
MNASDIPSSARRRKLRLDDLLVTRGLVETRAQAQRLILAGEVMVNDAPAGKPGSQVSDDAQVALKAGLRYVSRGGLKLEAALDEFALRPEGWVCADIGASTGGFSDCLLQRGAARIYALDVGYGQLAWTLRQDPRVISMERVNVRYLEGLPEPVRLATIDVSFISLELVLPRVVALLEPDGHIIALVKPQFEVGKGQVGKGGVVRELRLHREVLEKRMHAAAALGLAPAGLLRSPITGPAGNVEFLVWFRRDTPAPPDDALHDWITNQVIGT